jgi:hypothetical protein
MLATGRVRVLPAPSEAIRNPVTHGGPHQLERRLARVRPELPRLPA